MLGPMSARPDPVRKSAPPFAAVPRAMTRCECTGVAFSEIARLVEEQRMGLEAVQERTGCGQLCTACLPDLRDFLRSRR